MSVTACTLVYLIAVRKLAFFSLVFVLSILVFKSSLLSSVLKTREKKEPRIKNLSYDKSIVVNLSFVLG